MLVELVYTKKTDYIVELQSVQSCKIPVFFFNRYIYIELIDLALFYVNTNLMMYLSV